MKELFEQIQKKRGNTMTKKKKKDFTKIMQMAVGRTKSIAVCTECNCRIRIRYLWYEVDKKVFIAATKNPRKQVSVCSFCMLNKEKEAR